MIPTSNNPQKVVKPLARPTSGQQKKVPTTTASTKMEVLPSEQRKTISDFSKPQTTIKKEMKLERTGSAASKKVSTSVMSSTEVSAFDYPSERDLMSQSVRSNIKSSQDTEDLKKISSKPFSTKGKPKKNSVVADSTELNQSTKSTNVDGSQQHLSTPGTDANVSTSQALLSVKGDDENYLSAKRLDFNTTNADDLLMYDADDYRDNDKEEENIEIDINFEELRQRFEETANKQKELELMAKDYITHLLNAKSDTGEVLVKFPRNFQEIVDNTVEQTKTMEDLKDKGIVSEAGIQMFIQEQMIANLNEIKKTEEKKEDPYAKDRAKIKEYDRILAQKEREIRIKKDTEKMKRMQELEEFDEHEMSMENIDKVFLTEWQKKRKSGVSTAQVSAQKSKRQDEEKVMPTKPKMFTGKSHIKKNIQGAFNKAKDSLLSKLSERDQQRLENFMYVINKMIDNEGNEDDLLKEVIPNPYELGGGDAYRMQEIDRRMALLSVDQNVNETPEVPLKSLPKDKALRDQAEVRALKEKDEAITKKLMEMNNKEKLNEVFDSQTIIALAEKLKKENPDFGQDSNRKKAENDDDVLEKQFKEAVIAISGIDTNELLQDLESLSAQTQSVQKKLKNVMSSINNSQDQAKEEKYKSELLQIYSSRKEKLNYLESDTIQSDIDAIAKLEKNMFKVERDIIEAENKLMGGFSYVEPEYVAEPEKTVEDYDKEFMEKLKLQNPDLFTNMPEFDGDGEGEEEIDPKYKDVIIEEWQAEEKEEDAENKEPH